MDDLFLDFAGIKTESHPARLALKKIRAGDKLTIRKSNKHLELFDNDGLAIARLSRKAQEEWQDRLDTIREIRTVALVRRYREDVSDKDFQARCHGQGWNVPIVEFVV
jgi:ATP-dependent DNA helicase RecQ